MNVQVIRTAPIRIVMLRHTGPYEETSAEFDRLFQWVEVHQVPAGRTIGIYWDNPDYVPASRLRSAACAEVPPHFQLTDRGDLPLTLEEIAGGNYAITRHIGPYEEMASLWTRFTSYVEGTLRRMITDDPAFEVYLNDPSDTPADKLMTDLYMPVR